MIVTRLTVDTIRDAVESISKSFFNGNLIFNREPENISKNRVAFTLRVNDSKLDGAKRTRKFEGGMRRGIAACFHAYTLVINRLLILGATRIGTARRTFRRADVTISGRWDDIVAVEGDKNVGSMMMPLCYADACECGGRLELAMNNS